MPNLPAARKRIAQCWPATAPNHLTHRKFRQAVVVGGVVVVNIPSGIAVGIDIAMAWASTLVVPPQKFGAAAVEHWETNLIDVGAGNIGGTTHDHAILTVHSPAAIVEAGEQVVVPAMVGDRWSFDRVGRPMSIYQRVQRRIGRRRLTGRGIP